MSTRKTKIIALEGIDGSGKSVQIELLRRRLERNGHRTQVKSFPEYQSFFGRQIGVLLKGETLRADEVDSRSMCLWYALDRWQSFRDYRDGETDVLLINRYVLSNAVYQAIRERDMTAGLSDNWEWVKQLEHGQFSLPVPDLYLVLDVVPAVAQRNIDQKGTREYVDGRDVYEAQGGLLERARERYLDLAAREENIEVIFCMDEMGVQRGGEDIAQCVWAVLLERGLA